MTTSGWTGTWSATQIFTRRRGDQAWKSTLAGLLTGFSCLFEKPTRVNEYGTRGDGVPNGDGAQDGDGGGDPSKSKRIKKRSKKTD